MKRTLFRSSGKSLQTLLVTSILIMSTFMLSTQIRCALAVDTSIKVVPEILAFGPNNVTGQEFIIEVLVENVTNLYGIDVRFKWDTTYLLYLNHTAKIPVEDFSDGILHEPGMFIKDEVNATAGTYWLAYAVMAPAPIFEGTGIAFEMAFRIIYHPVYPEPSAMVSLHFESTDLPDNTGTPIPHDAYDGTVIIHAIPYEYPPRPMLKVTPETITVSTGEQFNSSVYIMGEDGGDLDPFWDIGGFDVYMNFRRADSPYIIAEALNVAIDPDGSFATFWPNGILEVEKTIDNDEGWIHVVFVGMPAVNGSHTPPHGNICIFTTTFNATYEDTEINVNITLKNPKSPVRRMTLDADSGIVNLASPVGTDWHSIDPYDFGTPYSLYSWTDTDGDTQLSPGDEILLNHTTTGKWHRYALNNTKGTLKLTQQPFPAFEDYIWMMDIPTSGLTNSGLPGTAVGGGTSAAYDGYGNPYWTGNFTLKYPFATVNQINATFLGFTPDNYTVTLTEGVDYIAYPDEDLIELLHPLDINITNECWTDGDNNTLNGWPAIGYVASGISSVYVDMHNGTTRYAVNNGFQKEPPAEWWYEPEYPWELEGWWALGYYPGPYNWPANSTWWLNYTAAAYLTVDYDADADLRPYYVEFDGTYADFLALGDPVDTDWDEIYPSILGSWNVYDWTDSDTSADITAGDHLMMTGNVGNRTYLVDNVATDIIVDQILTVDDVDQRSPFYGEEIIVGIAGFPHPERELSPWHNRDSSTPIPHDVENATAVIPEFPTSFVLVLSLMAASIIALLIKPKSARTKNNIRSKQ
jgi:hypothetical protein